uniref:Uncharacterized protein n=1 Tax=Noctiluca scintillans TaxID=2966 RepID=A0A7S1AQX9_NOCSC|mmetsp:Transcript_56351/g.150695  ORF Transcript_56351/g.150695 Transcript_56351/m.150695 type:complete len:279 (+) Transcript_56351:49-885(+)
MEAQDIRPGGLASMLSISNEVDVAMNRIQGFFSPDNAAGLDIALGYGRHGSGWTRGARHDDVDRPGIPVDVLHPTGVATRSEADGSSVLLPTIHSPGPSRADGEPGAGCEAVKTAAGDGRRPLLADQACQCPLANRRLLFGVPRTSRDQQQVAGQLRYLRVSEGSRDQFRQFAKSLASKVSVECAESNPYVQALQAHREELAQGSIHLQGEAVDSLESKLATQRLGGLATLTTAHTGRDNLIFSQCLGCDIQYFGEFEIVLWLQREVAKLGYESVPSR